MRVSRRLIEAGFLFIAWTRPLHPEDAASKWQAAFPVPAEPAQVYFRAHYVDGRGMSHELQVWRDGDKRLRRTTDAAIDLYVTRDSAGNLDYRIVDRARGILIHADQLALYRLGRFSGWPGLAHMLDIPLGPYKVTTLPAPAQLAQFGGCKWFRLEVAQPKTSSDICWSKTWGIPLTISVEHDGRPRTQFSAEDVHVFQSNDDAIFTIDSKHLSEVDARAGADLSD